MKLYKYCSKVHGSAFLSNGSLRIGTLYDFRDTEKYGVQVADRHEGTKKLAGTTNNLDTESQKAYPMLAGLINIEGKGTVGTLTVANHVVESPDLFVFSCATYYLLDAHVLWNEHESYDFCYCIWAPEMFFLAISAALGSEYEFLAAGSVQYSDELDYFGANADIHPAFVKRATDFSTQSEFRAIWKLGEPKDGLSPFILHSSFAHKFAAQHAAI